MYYLTGGHHQACCLAGGVPLFAIIIIYKLFGAGVTISGFASLGVLVALVLGSLGMESTGVGLVPGSFEGWAHPVVVRVFLGLIVCPRLFVTHLSAGWCNT